MRWQAGEFEIEHDSRSGPPYTLPASRAVIVTHTPTGLQETVCLYVDIEENVAEAIRRLEKRIDV